MKFVFLCGGVTGFTVTGAASLWAGQSAPRVLLDASLGCLAAALLFRWFWAVLVHGLRQTLLARHAAAVSAAAKKK
jgi:hypothetical protein